MKLNEALYVVKQELNDDRFEHTKRVIETAEHLASCHSVSVDKATLAAALHDYAKCWPTEKLRKYILISPLPKDLLLYNHELWHGPVASILLPNRIGIKDRSILNAIRYHTTGRAHMSSLEMVIFVSDYIEPGRHFPGVDQVREVAEDHLVKAAWLAVKQTINYLLERQGMIYPDTIHAYNTLTRQIFHETDEI